METDWSQLKSPQFKTKLQELALKQQMFQQLQQEQVGLQTSIANVLAAEKQLNRRRIASCEYQKNLTSKKLERVLDSSRETRAIYQTPPIKELQYSYDMKNPTPQSPVQYRPNLMSRNSRESLYDDAYIKFNKVQKLDAPIQEVVESTIVRETKHKKLTRKRQINQLMKAFHSKVLPQNETTKPKNLDKFGLFISKISPNNNREIYKALFRSQNLKDDSSVQNRILKLQSFFETQEKDFVVPYSQVVMPPRTKPAKKQTVHESVTQRASSQPKINMREIKLQDRLQRHFTTLFNQQELHKMLILPIPNYQHKYRCYVAKGNNGQVVRSNILKRWWWKLVEKPLEGTVHMLWTQNKNSKYLEQQSTVTAQEVDMAQYTVSRGQMAELRIEVSHQHLIKRVRKAQEREYMLMNGTNDFTCHNHLRNNEQIGNKRTLYYTMEQYYEQSNQHVSQYLPITFVVTSTRDNQFQEMCKYINEHENDAWLVKPGENSNRGRGIKIFRTSEQIRDYIEEYQQKSVNSNATTFIVQRYILDLMLYKKRKFDIRCYMLMTCFNGRIKGYWYQDGYVRTASQQFQFDDFSNHLIHLTNDAVQKLGPDYGRFEQGNKLSLNELNVYVAEITQHQSTFFEDIFPKLEELAIDVMQASAPVLDLSREGLNFEIFGLDFMIDQSLQPWLIEVNTNPCLETPCSLLSCIIPEMLDNAFKLTLDVVFPPPSHWTIQRILTMQEIDVKKFKLVFEEE